MRATLRSDLTYRHIYLLSTQAEEALFLQFFSRLATRREEFSLTFLIFNEVPPSQNHPTKNEFSPHQFRPTKMSNAKFAFLTRYSRHTVSDPKKLTVKGTLRSS